MQSNNKLCLGNIHTYVQHRHCWRTERYGRKWSSRKSWVYLVKQLGRRCKTWRGIQKVVERHNKKISNTHHKGEFFFKYAFIGLSIVVLLQCWFDKISTLRSTEESLMSLGPKEHLCPMFIQLHFLFGCSYRRAKLTFLSTVPVPHWCQFSGLFIGWCGVHMLRSFSCWH